MRENEKPDPSGAPMLFPYDPERFWEKLREIVRQEVQASVSQPAKNGHEVEPAPGFTQKPLLKINEVCELFQVSRPTIYDWIKHGKLRPYRVHRRLYFLWNDIQKLFPSIS